MGYKNQIQVGKLEKPESLCFFLYYSIVGGPTPYSSCEELPYSEHQFVTNILIRQLLNDFTAFLDFKTRGNPCAQSVARSSLALSLLTIPLTIRL